MAEAKQIEIFAHWDAEGGVWVATSDDVPGLITEAETTEKMLEKLQVLVPELRELSGIPPEPLRILLHSDRTLLLPA